MGGHLPPEITLQKPESSLLPLLSSCGPFCRSTISLLLSMFWFLAGRHVRAQLSLGGEVLSPGLPGQVPPPLSPAPFARGEAGAVLKGRPVQGCVSERGGDLLRPDSGRISELGAGPPPVEPVMTAPQAEVLVTVLWEMLSQR